ncbi:MAG: hypothetical protein HQK75_15255 [Candidatus Magnetomorum sp.]|nr:hypothetical protein [Candidatus Magnetomorum sp.]
MNLNKSVLLKMMGLSLFMIFFHTAAHAFIPGDIDRNGVINLKDCLHILQRLANPPVTTLFEVVQAKPVISGTYSQTDQSGKTTYTFNDDGTCLRVGPDDMESTISTEGTWHYENNNLHINTSGEIQVFISKLTINIDEIYENAFTNADGSKLVLVPPGKIMSNEPDLFGMYTGKGDVQVTTGISFGDKSITVESSLNVQYDGSWESTITIVTNGDPEVKRYSGKVDSSKPTIYTFGNSYFPDVFLSEDEKVYYEKE